MSLVGDAAGSVASAISDAVSSIFGAGGGQAPKRAVEVVVRSSNAGLEAIANIMAQEHAAVKELEPYAKTTGQDIRDVERDWEANFTRLLDVILPHSFSHLSGRIYAQGIDPLRRQVASIDARLAALSADVQSIDTYLNQTVKPNLATLLNFVALFTRKYQPPLDQLIVWLAAPKQLADFIVSPMTTDLIGFLAAGQNQAQRDALNQIMLEAWVEQPAQTWAAVEQWLVT